MTLNELKEQLQENMITYLSDPFPCENHDVFICDDVVSNICQIIVDTFNDTFYDGSLTSIDLITKTLDTTTSN